MTRRMIKCWIFVYYLNIKYGEKNKIEKANKHNNLCVYFPRIWMNVSLTPICTISFQINIHRTHNIRRQSAYKRQIKQDNIASKWSLLNKTKSYLMLKQQEKEIKEIKPLSFGLLIFMCPIFFCLCVNTRK